MNKIQIVLIKPNEPAIITQIDKNLESYYEAMDCSLIQAIYPYDDPVALVCDDEGKINGSKPNRLLFDEEQLVDVIYGTFMIVGLTHDDFGTLSDELAEKYCCIFNEPGIIIKDDTGGRARHRPAAADIRHDTRYVIALKLKGEKETQYLCDITEEKGKIGISFTDDILLAPKFPCEDKAIIKGLKLANEVDDAYFQRINLFVEE